MTQDMFALDDHFPGACRRHPHAEMHQALDGGIFIGFENGKQLTAIDGIARIQGNKAVEKRPLLFTGERTLTTQQHPECQFESFLPHGDAHGNSREVFDRDDSEVRP